MHPILFHVPLPHYGTVPIYSYGIMLAISLIVGWFLTLGLSTREGLPREAMANCYVDTAVMALLGSRILYIVTNPEEFTSIASLFAMRSGGLVAYGGFLGGLVGSFLSLHYGVGLTRLVRFVANRLSSEARKPWTPLPFLPWADVAVPSLAVGLGITRVGCYMFGCDFGRPLGENAPAFLKKLGTFPHWPEGMMGDGGIGSPAWDHHQKLHLISLDSPTSLPVHPTQIYESILGVVLLVVLLVLRRNQRFRGEIFLWFTFLYGGARFLLELVRDDVERGNVPPSLSPHVLLPPTLGLLGVTYAVGIAPRLVSPATRIATQVLAFVPALWAFVATQPKEFESVRPMELSTSQFVGLISGLLAGAAFWVLNRAALAHPESAMALPDFSAHLESANEDEGADDEAEEERPKKREPRARKKGTIAKNADVITDEHAEADAADESVGSEPPAPSKDAAEEASAENELVAPKASDEPEADVFPPKKRKKKGRAKT